jgi:DNA-3-methyladenine glycosylase I
MSDPVQRCPWCGSDPLYLAYHDEEWGVPEHDGRALFEKLILEGFQAGLSWITILRKRQAFRTAFADFRPEVIAGWGAAEVERLLDDAGIVRHRGKIEATIAGAKAFLRIETGEGFSAYLWGFVGGKPIINRLDGLHRAPSESPQSRAMSKALKAEGFKFCGPTITYAFMQAAGLVNDHLISCPRHAALAQGTSH